MYNDYTKDIPWYINVLMKDFQKIGKDCSLFIFPWENSTPHCGFTLSQRILIWTNFEIHYQPPHKFWLFGPNGLREEEFTKQWFLLFFKFLIIFPSKRTRLIRITRHAVNQGSKFGKNKNSKKKMAQCRILEAMKIRKVYDNDDSEHILSRKNSFEPSVGKKKVIDVK